MTGQVSYLKGDAAETQVMMTYLANGYRLLARRWRGPVGEIDLIFGHGQEVIFVEVKASRTHAQAVSHLSTRQIQRIIGSAEACLAYFPLGGLTPVRFDVALVDSHGRIDVVENALCAA